ncbi:rhombosortase [Vibrio chagasii]|nr:rhombosortase [Vibrio chagasii]
MQAWVVWDKSAIVDGQWWRILTGNFSHTNYSHLLMNLAGLWIISYLFQPTRKQLISALAMISLITAGFVAFKHSDLCRLIGNTAWIVWLIRALREALNGRKRSWLLVSGLVAKIAWEQFVGPSSTTGELI